MRRTLLNGIAGLFLSPLLLMGQGLEGEEELIIRPGDTLLTLQQTYVLSGSVRLLPARGGEVDTALYQLQSGPGRLRISPQLRDSLLLSGDSLVVTARYSYLPLDLPPEFFLRELKLETDSTGSQRIVASTGDGGGLTASDIFGSDFQRSGSITRGVVVGTNRDLTLQSGLRLEFRGMVAEDVEVLGSLSDEQTPIQPEGNTQTLREVDNIFFEVRSPVADATLGKFFAEQRGSEFTTFRRKLQGVRGVGKFGEGGNTQLIAALSPGSFRTQEFQGREGDQGPYRLTGASGERDIVVLAGTERVFVDGVEMVRGRENDYVVDYGTGEILFQPQRPITGFNEIVVDFEFTTRRYSRSLLAASHNGFLADSLIGFHLSWVREADNPDAPIDLEYTDEDRALLAAAGADANGAVRSGVRLVGRSDTGSGLYRPVDTTLNGEQIVLYRYDPTSDEAIFDVTFSRAPDGRGDYRSVAFGRYDYVGPGLGEYLPVTYLPLPVEQQVAALGVEYRPVRNGLFRGEISLGGLNQNRLSALEGTSLSGIGLKGEMRLLPDSLRVAGTNLGLFSGRASVRYLQGGYQPIGRISDPEFERTWNTTTRIGIAGFDNLLAESLLEWQPERGLGLRGEVGQLRQGDFFRSTRNHIGIRYGRTDRPFAGDGQAEIIDTKDSTEGGELSSWAKLMGGVAYRIGPITPGFRASYQNRQNRDERTDTLEVGSFRFLEGGPDLTVDLKNVRTTISARVRLNDSARFDPATVATRFFDESQSNSYAVRGELRGLSTLRTTLDFTYRERLFDPLPDGALSSLDNSTILARSETRWSPFDRGIVFDAVYNVQTEQAARLQRLFVQVPVGEGPYIWVDLDSNGIQSEEEFRETISGEGEYVRINLPTEELFPVVDLSADVRLRVDLPQIFHDTSRIGALLGGIVTETNLRLGEKSNTDDELSIYLLNLSRFQDDSTTILGNTLLQQEIYLFENVRDVSLRVRHVSRTGLTRLFSGAERSASAENSLRLRWSPTDDLGLEVNGGLIDRSLLGDELDLSRAYDLGIAELSSDLEYFVSRSLELGWLFRLRDAEDVVTPQPRSTTLTGNEVRATYSIETKGRVRASLERSVVDGSNLEGGDIFSLPFQLTDGYAIGTTWRGRLAFDYRFGANIQATLSYNGRAEPPASRVMHTGGLEVRAFF